MSQEGFEAQKKAAIVQQKVENWLPAGLTDGFPLAHIGFAINI